MIRGLSWRRKGRAPEASGSGGGPAPDLSWVPSFWASVKDYVCAREEDEVLILPPNLVYKTNRTGLAILRWLDAGLPVEDFPGMNPARLAEAAAFLAGIRDLCEGRPAAVESLPYDFDYSRLPILGELAVTYRCDNACRFCYAGCGAEGAYPSAGGPGSDAAQGGRGPGGILRGPGSSAREASLPELKRIVDVFKDKAKIPFFSLTGGEPLLRPELEDLISYAVSRGLRVNLITNATLASPARAASLFAAGLRTAQVSLESPDPAVHDGLCGASGAHAGTLAGIAALKAAGISVQTNSTLTRLNRESLLGMPDYLKELGIGRFSMNLYIPAAGPARAFPRAAETAAELFVPYSETGAFVDAVHRRARALGQTFYWYSPTPLCLFNPMARGLGNKSCAAADGLLHVDPAGQVLPCSSYPEALGNLLERDFGEIWFSARAAHFKRKRYAPESCRRCEAFTACQAACPLYWDYAGYGELAGAQARKPELLRAGQGS